MDPSQTEPQTEARDPRGRFRLPDRTNTLQILLGLLLPSAFLLAFLKWQRLTYWMFNRAEDGFEHVIKSNFEFSVFETISRWPWRSLDVLKSDFALLFAFTAIALMLVYAVRTRVQKLAVLVGLQLLTIAFCVLETAIFFYHNRTGANPDLTLLTLFVERFDQFERVVSAEGSSTLPMISLLIGGFLLVFPWLLRRVITPDEQAGPVDELAPGHRHFLGLTTSVVVFASVAFLPAWTQLPEEVTGNAVLNIARIAARGDAGPSVPDADIETPPIFATLVEDSPEQPPPNVVVIILESTRTDAMSIYNPEEVSTTPFLRSLEDESLIFDRHYTTVPHTSKALVSVLCGVQPHWRSVTSEALPGSLPSRCMPEMARRKGYATAFFQTATRYFEDRDALVENMGYEHFFAGEDVDSSKDFEIVNYFGYEEDAMFRPSIDWVDDERERPIFLTYLTVMAHSPYTPPGVERSEGRTFDQVMEHYRESIRYSDVFVEKIFDAFRERGLYENTVFVILSDHGEAFGEHGLWAHNGILYEETARSAMVIHDPRRPDIAGREDDVTSHLDLLPTLSDLMGYSIEQGDYPGRSLLDPVPDRKLYLHGWYQNRVLGSVDPRYKLIYYFGDRPTERYDLRRDPLEKKPLEMTADREQRQVDELLRRRNANHRMFELFGAGKRDQRVLSPTVNPEVQLERELADGVELVGLDRPLPFGRLLSRRVNFYVRLEPGRYEVGTPMSLRIESGGELLDSVDFELFQEVVEVEEPAAVGRAVEVVLPRRPPSETIDLVLVDGAGGEITKIEEVGLAGY
ncbi:MAG: LTA synthase family protein [Myxococcota bacterium]